MQCAKCNKNFPRVITIDGKKRNLCSRKFCLDCSPFGCHNTKSLESKISIERFCKICHKAIYRKNEKGTKCWTCTNRLQRANAIEKLKTLFGDSCCSCGYNKCWQALDFHHVIAETKLFPLTTRELQFKWDRILNEAKKCILVCCRCHREIHCGLISDEKVKSLWQKQLDHVSNAQENNESS